MYLLERRKIMRLGNSNNETS